MDSSALIAAAISPGGAGRELILRALRGEYRLVVSPLVLQETERNLGNKAPGAIPAFRGLRQALPETSGEPSKRLVLRVARTVHVKDAPIVAAAIQERAVYLVTYDRRHLLAQQEQILANFGLAVVTPDTVLRVAGQGQG